MKKVTLLLLITLIPFLYLFSYFELGQYSVLTLIAVGMWLLLISTVPWYTYTAAKSVIADSKAAKELGYAFDDSKVEDAKKLAASSLGIAMLIHVLSALIFFALRETHLGDIGTIAGVIALFVFFARPIYYAIEGSVSRMERHRTHINYPENHIRALKRKLTILESHVKNIESTVKGINDNYVPKNDFLRMKNDLIRSVQNISDDIASVDAIKRVIELIKKS